MVSAAAWIDAAGVFSSCDALATRSRRAASSRRPSVTSRTTNSTVPSSSTGIAVPRSHRLGAPVSTSTATTDPPDEAPRIASRNVTGWS